jgi:hypothetical protein
MSPSPSEASGDGRGRGRAKVSPLRRNPARTAQRAVPTKSSTVRRFKLARPTNSIKLQPVDETTDQKPPAENPLPKIIERTRRPLPQGYRQGIITAITVLFGFTLGFFRFWGFESPGKWTLISMIPAITLITAMILQIVALFRALDVADDDEIEYRKTVKWFIASATVLVVGMSLALLDFYDLIPGL